MKLKTLLIAGTLSLSFTVAQAAQVTINEVDTKDMTRAGNPVVKHMFTADPTARVINNKLFVFPSTDVLDPNSPAENGFSMPYYHIFSSENLIDWTDHGRQIDQVNVPWGDKDAYAMWAPCCIEKNGKFYYYFPNKPEEKSKGNFRRVGVATATNPEGPYTIHENFMQRISGIDPNAFIDDDGKAYIYWGGGANNSLVGARLQDNMLEIEGDIVRFEGLPAKYKEASFMFKRNGKYYFTFSCSLFGNCDLVYAVGKSPLGPFKYVDSFMDKWNNCWTNHHSLVEYNGEWILFYHHNDISGKDKQRSICADYVTFSKNGKIEKVTPTMRGIGVCSATKRMDIDRYSTKSETLSIGQDKEAKIANWYLSKVKAGDWSTFNKVRFSGSEKNIEVVFSSATAGGTLEVREGDGKGKVIATIELPTTGSWDSYKQASTAIEYSPKGVVDLYFTFKGSDQQLFNIDWIRFK